jgi:urease subunit alpha
MTMPMKNQPHPAFPCATPDIAVDPETYEARSDGDLPACESATVLPLAQRYFLY